MVQIFILGSSSAYGVGSSIAGWGDLVKQYFHARMYGEGGEGEKYEVYNLAKSGATIDYVKKSFPQQLKDYGRGQDVILIVSVGGNNSKAEGEPDNFVSSPEEFEQEMENLLKELKQVSKAVIVVGNGYVDEAKTNPKPNPLTGGRSYFTNSRRQHFSEITKRVCQNMNIGFVTIDIDKNEWLKKYLYEDGLHPNQEGHQLIFDKLKPLLNQAIR